MSWSDDLEIHVVQQPEPAPLSWDDMVATMRRLEAESRQPRAHRIRCGQGVARALFDRFAGKTAYPAELSRAYAGIPMVDDDELGVGAWAIDDQYGNYLGGGLIKIADQLADVS